jgi:hypothetical protein
LNHPFAFVHTSILRSFFNPYLAPAIKQGARTISFYFMLANCVSLLLFSTTQLVLAGGDRPNQHPYLPDFPIEFDKPIIAAGYDEAVVAYDEPVVLSSSYDEPIVLPSAYDEPIVLPSSFDEPVVLSYSYDEPVVLSSAYDVPVYGGPPEAIPVVPIIPHPAYGSEPIIVEDIAEIVPVYGYDSHKPIISPTVVPYAGEVPIPAIPCPDTTLVGGGPMIPIIDDTIVIPSHNELPILPGYGDPVIPIIDDTIVIPSHDELPIPRGYGGEVPVIIEEPIVLPSHAELPILPGYGGGDPIIIEQPTVLPFVGEAPEPIIPRRKKCRPHVYGGAGYEEPIVLPVEEVLPYVPVYA